MDYNGEWGGGGGPGHSGGPLNDSGGGGDFESADKKYAVWLSVFIDFFDNNNTVEKHLFFLIQSILLFHDRCCFKFFQLLYMYDYNNDKNTAGKHLFFLFKVYYFILNFRIMLS